MHRPAQLLRARALGRVLPDPAERAHDLRREEHLRPLRHHHERDAVRAGVGGPRHPRDLEHHAAARTIYAQEGIAQVLFFEADEDDICATSYGDKRGKYQAQRGVTLPRI